MKKIITSASLAAVSVAGLQVACAQTSPAPDTSKVWSVSASLRGFYDDNYALRPSNLPGDPKRDSFGFEFSPSAALNLHFERTYVGLNYTYGLRWFEDRSDDPIDQSHYIDLQVDHPFTETVKLSLKDNFAIFQEPQLGGTITDPLVLRSQGDNMQNRADIALRADLTRVLGFEVGYNNLWYDYDQDGPGSYSALLDRLEHLARLDLRWMALPTTVGILGYQFGVANHTSEDPLLPGYPLALADPTYRDTLSHYVYVGADQSFTAELLGSLRLGARYTEYPEAPSTWAAADATWSPYADASVTYSYLPGSNVRVGVRHDRNTTDAVSAALTVQDVALDQETTAAYFQLTHRITPKLTGSLIGQFQYGQFNGGTLDDETECLYLLGLNVAYQFNRYFAGEVGYNFDRIDSDVWYRSYGRNRFYVGVRASY